MNRTMMMMWWQEQQHWKWRFYVTLYVCKVCCLKKPNNKRINLDRLVITRKYQTSVFYVRTVKTSVSYFPVMTALPVNKTLLK